MTSIRRGDVYYIEPYMTEGCEQRAGRPAVIVSNDLANKHSPVVEVVYFTTQPKNDMPTHVIIRSTSRESTALCEQITSVSKTRLGDYICTLTPDELCRINVALMTSLALDFEASEAEADDKTPNPPPAEYRSNRDRAGYLQKALRESACPSFREMRCFLCTAFGTALKSDLYSA